MLSSNTTIANTAANILKYKKYIKPLVSCSKLMNRYSPSPLNIQISQKLGKRTKTGSEIQRLQSKIEESFKSSMNKNHTLSVDFANAPSS